MNNINLELENIKKEIEQLSKSLTNLVQDFNNLEYIKSEKYQKENKENEFNKEMDDILIDWNSNENNKYYFNLLKSELEKMKKYPNFKIRKLSEFIENIELGKFNKQKFNKFIREKIIPQAEQKEKNQFLYDKRHISYAIIFQCFKSLDTIEFSQVLDGLKNIQFDENDIYSCIESITVNELLDEINIKNLAQLSIYIYITYKDIYKGLMKNLIKITEKNIKEEQKYRKEEHPEKEYLLYNSMYIEILEMNEIISDYSKILKRGVIKGINNLFEGNKKD